MHDFFQLTSPKIETKIRMKGSREVPAHYKFFLEAILNRAVKLALLPALKVSIKLNTHNLYLPTYQYNFCYITISIFYCNKKVENKNKPESAVLCFT